MIKPVRKYFDGLLIVGGGITEPEAAKNISKAGANILVIGNLMQNTDLGFQVPGGERLPRILPNR
ncbi:MAG: hypothetical protein HY619_06035 [Thaumarchaeota archaeon]|nr:hypothetical protein [Nitrososphaerota archaeon]